MMRGAAMEFRNYMSGNFFAIKDGDAFGLHMKKALKEVKFGGIFASDNMITFSKNLSFLGDAKFMAAVQRHVNTDIERAILWRQYIVAWAARQSMRLEGDFVECACYKGTTARIVCDYLDFAKLDRHYYLYDLFEHDPSMPHHSMTEHSKELYGKTKERFAEFRNVTVTQGAVPEVLHQISPEKIAFLHIDLNNADAEIGALELLFDRLVPGGIMILDDYGWIFYHPQKTAEDPWLEKRGYSVLELPTGQGLVIK